MLVHLLLIGLRSPRMAEVRGIGVQSVTECRQRLGEFLALAALIAGIRDARVRAAAFDLLRHEGMKPARAYLERIAA